MTYDLLTAVGEVPEAMLSEALAYPAEKEKRRQKSRRFLRIASTAAAFVLLASCVFSFVFILTHPKTASCSGGIGALIGGVYYFPGQDGICAYSPANGLQVLVNNRAREDSPFCVDENALYYVRGRTVMARLHETGKEYRLYTADAKWESVLLEETAEGGLILSLHTQKPEARLTRLLLDTKTGKTLRVLTPDTAVNESVTTERFYPLGENRTIGITKVQENPSGSFASENGVRFTTPDTTVSVSGYDGAHLFLSLHQTVSDAEGNAVEIIHTTRVLSRDFPDRVLEKEEEPLCMIGDEVVFRIWTGEPGCYDWYLLSLSDGSRRLLLEKTPYYEAVSDGTLLYACAPWTQDRPCFAVEKDEAGNVSGLALLSESVL